MSLARLGLLVLTPVAALALGCSFMTSLDGLQGVGPIDAAAGDAGGNDSKTDAPVDAGPPPCGAPGESCCVAPLAPCADGLACSNGSKKCTVNDAWALGEYKAVTATNLVTVIVTAHYDGTSWTRGADVVSEVGLTTSHVVDLHETSSGVVRAIITKSSIGKMLNWNGFLWAECKTGNSCPGPSGENLQAVTSVTNGGLEVWVSSVNQMYRCGTTSCASEITGATGTWGAGAFAGTTAQDLWYSAFDHALRFDGTKWSLSTVADAYTIGELAPNDLWAGTKQLRHWDGKAWSNAYLVDGAPTTGTVLSISGAASNDGWAVGSEFTTPGPSFAAHWDGSGWSMKKLPDGIAHVQRVWAPSPTEAFVVGDKNPGAPTGVIARWDGAAWTEMTSPTVTYSGETQPGSLRWYFVSGRARPRR